MSKFQEPFHSTILKRIHTIFKFHVSNFSKGMYLYFHFSTPFIKYIHTKAMAGQEEEGMELNSRERRLYNRRIQQQQLLSTLAETMMQGQSSSSSTGEGGLEAVGQLLKDWSRSRKEAPAQPKRPPVVVPPPKKAAAAAAPPPSPWRSFPPAPPPPPLEKAAAAALSNE